MSERARAVTAFTAAITSEHEARRAGKVFPLGDLRLYECPLSYITAETWEVVRLTYQCESTGHLLHAGGIGDQPHWLIEALEIFRVESGRARQKAKDGKKDRDSHSGPGRL